MCPTSSPTGVAIEAAGTASGGRVDKITIAPGGHTSRWLLVGKSLCSTASLENDWIADEVAGPSIGSLLGFGPKPAQILK